MEGITDERRGEAVNLMCRLADYVTQQMTEKYFLEPYTVLATDPVAHVREACAMGAGRIFSAVGRRLATDILFPKFLALCVDDRWMVRKACAECMVQVSSSLEVEIEKATVPRIFVSLLCDESRRVKFAAYQNLGKLIARFGQVHNGSDVENSVTSSDDDRLSSPSDSDSNDEELGLDIAPNKLIGKPVFVSKCFNPTKLKYAISEMDYCEMREMVTSFGAERYNSFIFWRLPFPDIEIDVGMLGGSDTLTSVADETQISATEAKTTGVGGRMPQTVQHVLSSKTAFNTPLLPYSRNKSKEQPHERGTALRNSDSCRLFPDKEVTKSQLHEWEMAPASKEQPLYSQFPTIRPEVMSPSTTRPTTPSDDDEEEENCSPYDQVVVPPELLVRYRAMVEPMLSLSVDSELMIHCAYSFPAVLSTLGRRYWPYMKEVCQELATSEQWKVRRIIAAALHELARILGRKISSRYLHDLFLFFLNDVNEVRVEVIKNLAAFLKYTLSSKRGRLLPEMKHHFEMRNDPNWRLRHTLARELIKSVRLFEASDVNNHILPTAVSLLKDKVCAVREQAINLVAVILRRMERKSSERYALISELVDVFGNSNVWRWRQMFVYLSLAFTRTCSIRARDYGRQIGGNLLTLAFDSVPNVRISVANCLADLPESYLKSIKDHHSDVLSHAVSHLKNDIDFDVRQIGQKVYSVLSYTDSSVFSVYDGVYNHGDMSDDCSR